MWSLKSFRSSSPRPPHTTARRWTLEALEDRALLSFSPAASYPVGTDPQALATADFNGDGRLDLAVANLNAATVGVLLGNADGTFQPARNSATGIGPRAVAVGDFNADGKLDLATANASDASVLLGRGDGAFGVPAHIGIGTAPQSVAVGDFNADGKLDLGVTSNYYIPGGSEYGSYFIPVGRVSVLLGSGAGSFAAPRFSGQAFANFNSAVVEDFNGDGRDDFATVNQADPSSISFPPYPYGAAVVFLSNPDGSPGAPSSFWAGANPEAVAAGDVTGDGTPDLVAVHRSDGNLTVLPGDGRGGFGAAVSYPGVGSVSVALGDFNGPGGDGHLDIVTANSTGGLSVFLGRGDGTLLPPLISTSGPPATEVTAGDFNGDGWLDLATANPSANRTSVLLNDRTWFPPDTPSITIDDVTVTEANAATIGARFTVRLSSASAWTVTVRIATVDGTAVAGVDYRAASQTLTFAPGQTVQSVTVLVNGDRLAEPDESFSVRLSDSINAFLADSEGVGTILDDEPTVSIAESVTGREGNVGTTAFLFTVTLSAASDAPVAVDYATHDYYAAAGEDYAATSGTLTFAPGETVKAIAVLIYGDRRGESDEHFYVNLNGTPTVHLDDVRFQSVGTILDDEPHLRIDDTTVVEGNSGEKSMTFTVTLSAASDAPVTVDYTTAESGAVYYAVAGQDYVAKYGRLTFAPGQTTRTITVRVKGDRLGENDESFLVHLTGASGAAISDEYGFGTILDDEPHISVVNPAPILEGNGGTRTLTFTVTLSAAYDQAVTVRYASQDSVADVRTDYYAASGMLTFAPGQTTKTVTVKVRGDKKRESEESFALVLSAASRNAFVDYDNYGNYGWGTILDDD